MFFGLRPKRKDPQSFEESALEHVDALYGAALRLTRDSNEAQDLVQDALVRAYRFQDHFQPGTNLKAWLLRILTNNFINHYRRHARERKALDHEEGSPVGEGVMSRDSLRGLNDAVSLAQEGLLRQEILEALDSLPEDYRVIIVLADVEELSYKEIAETLSVPIGTVMSRLHRARKLLQRQLYDQAVQMGIVSAPPANDPEPAVDGSSTKEQPLDFEAFRQKKLGARR